MEKRIVKYFSTWHYDEALREEKGQIAVVYVYSDGTMQVTPCPGFTQEEALTSLQEQWSDDTKWLVDTSNEEVKQ